jgi:hypothetical protein
MLLPQQPLPIQFQVKLDIHAQDLKMVKMKMIKLNIQDLHAQKITAVVPPGQQMLMRMIPLLKMMTELIPHSIRKTMQLNKD